MPWLQPNIHPRARDHYLVTWPPATDTISSIIHTVAAMSHTASMPGMEGRLRLRASPWQFWMLVNKTCRQGQARQATGEQKDCWGESRGGPRAPKRKVLPTNCHNPWNISSRWKAGGTAIKNTVEQLSGGMVAGARPTRRTPFYSTSLGAN